MEELKGSQEGSRVMVSRRDLTVDPFYLENEDAVSGIVLVTKTV
jgi:hypothetical protein